MASPFSAHWKRAALFAAAEVADVVYRQAQRVAMTSGLTQEDFEEMLRRAIERDEATRGE